MNKKYLIISLIVFMTLSLSSCLGDKSTGTKTDKTKITSSESNKKSLTAEELNALKVLTPENQPANGENTISKGTQSVKKLMLEHGIEFILEVDCTSYDEEGKTFCMKEQKRVLEWKNEVTWGGTLRKGDEYVKSFDCDLIKSPDGKKECTDYKEKIQK